MASGPKKSKNDGAGYDANARHLARLGAVQALYQMDVASSDVVDVIEQFTSHRFVTQPDGTDQDGGENIDLSGGDVAFFQDIVEGVVRVQRELDPLIDQQLAAGWRLVRVDSILRAILRAGTFELMHRKDVPPRVVINEYLNVSHAFFFGDEPRVVNGVLDAIAKRGGGDTKAVGSGNTAPAPEVAEAAADGAPKKRQDKVDG